MRVTTTKSKNAESFYITKAYINDAGKSTSKIIRKLGSLKELSEKLGADRDGVMAWAKEQAAVETLKYKQENESRIVVIPFHSERQIDFNKQKFFKGGYLFLQSLYYGLSLDQTCLKIKAKYKLEYDLNAILSDLVYTRILEPHSIQAAHQFLEPPTYELHDVYRVLNILACECDFIQSEVFKNSRLVVKRNDRALYYDCTNYYFEMEQEDDDKRYGKSKEHRPNPIIQMGLFTDGDGIPLAFSLFPGNQKEQASLKPLETKIIKEFGCDKFIYCGDAGLGSESNRAFNHADERAFIVTQSIKILPAEERAWALAKTGFRRISDDTIADIIKLTAQDENGLFYKDIPYSTKRLHQRLIITYSPKYAAYQKTIRGRQIERTEKMLAEEEKYDGLYAVCTDLLDDHPRDIIKVSEGRWQMEECFRNLKTDFSARSVCVRREDRIKAHFLTCFLALLILRLLEKILNHDYTYEKILHTLKGMNFAGIEEQGYMPLYSRQSITDALHDACGFRTDFQFITKRQMKTIQKKSKGRE